MMIFYWYFREDMRNSFNFLLIALICMDSCYLVGAILESFRKCFLLASDIHIQMFPYFLYPGINIAGKFRLKRPTTIKTLYKSEMKIWKLKLNSNIIVFTVTCSIIMTVGIALERYIAVHYPIDYSQAINSPEACR